MAQWTKVIGLKFKDVSLGYKPLTTNAAVNNLSVPAYRNNNLSKQFHLVIAEYKWHHRYKHAWSFRAP